MMMFYGFMSSTDSPASVSQQTGWTCLAWVVPCGHQMIWILQEQNQFVVCRWNVLGNRRLPSEPVLEGGAAGSSVQLSDYSC